MRVFAIPELLDHILDRIINHLSQPNLESELDSCPPLCHKRYPNRILFTASEPCVLHGDRPGSTAPLHSAGVGARVDAAGDSDGLGSVAQRHLSQWRGVPESAATG